MIIIIIIINIIIIIIIAGFGNKKTSEDHPNYGIIKIGQNTEEGPGDLRRFAVTHTQVKKYRLTLV